MCGICGFIGEVDDSKKVLKQMMDKIAHRGPDDEGMYVDKHAAIGHRRLSIIDLSHGAQPMYNEMCIRDRFTLTTIWTELIRL